MSHSPRSSVLPLAATLAGIGLLVVLSPYGWRSIATSGSNAQHPGGADRSAPAPRVALPAAGLDHAGAPAAASAETALAAEPVAAIAPSALERFAIPAEPVEPAPLVAEKIELDPSVPETPALPPAPVIDNAPPAPEIENESEPESSASQPAPEPRQTFSQPEEEPAEPAPAPVAVQREVAQPTSEWPSPNAMAEELESLPAGSAIAAWRARILAALDRLQKIDVLTADEAKSALQDLEALVAEGSSLIARASTVADRAAIRRVQYALSRRVDVWSRVRHIAANEQVRHVAIVDNTDAVARKLAEADYQLGALAESAVWRRYLLLDEAREAARVDVTAGEQRELARRILLRLDSPLLDSRQQGFFEQEVFQDLRRELRVWADEPVDHVQLLAALERYEQSGSTIDARAVAAAYQVLRWAPGDEVAELAERVNAHYRNANLRVALSGDLINRLLPTPDELHEPIEDNILGASVYGRSRISTRLRTVLIPDRHRWRLGVEAHGHVDSETESYSGPAVFYNEGQLRYRARKLLLIDRAGVRQFRAEAEADSQNNLTGMETDYDAVPLLNFLARTMARNQYDSQHYDAKWEVEEKAADRASRRLDVEVQRRLAAAEQAVEEEVLQPLRELELNPVAVDLQTTEDRLIARYRLAGREQLGSHTPRPQAPSDSLLSVQIHHTALNNTVEKLNLDGRRVDLRELYRELSDTFQGEDAIVPDDIPDDVTVQFAPHDSVRAEFIEGRVRVTIRLAELQKKGGRRWRNFAVRAYYRPAAVQRNANLVRDGHIELPGRLRTFDRIALLGIFNKVLSKDRTFNIINDKLAESPKLHDLEVTQFVIRDGWIGVALGPQRTPAGQVKRYAGGHLDDDVR